MGKGITFECWDIDTSDIKENIDRALLAAAFKVRDDARREFIASKPQYKYATSDYDKLANGIMIGRLKNSEVKVHALGNNSDQTLWKTRFFVGSTIYRTQNKRRGESLNKPYTKGFIKGNDAIDKAVSQNETTLDIYIHNVLNKK